MNYLLAGHIKEESKDTLLWRIPRQMMKFCIGLTVGIMSLMLGSLDVFADDSITVTISGNPTITLAPTSEGTFADSGNTNISVSNAPSSGYTLAITGGGNTSLTGKTDNTKSITSISSAIDQNTFNTSTYNNKWGYKPSMHYNTSTEQRANNSNYLPSPDANGDIIDVTSDNSSNNYTLSIGARVTSDLGFQTYESNTFVIAAVANMVQCDNTKLCVQYDGNGLTFDGETVNRVNYNSTSTQGQVTKYSHTPNVGDDGISNGTYIINSDITDTVTINGASSLNVAVYYDTESYYYDYVSIYQSPFDISTSNDVYYSNTTGNRSGRIGGHRSDSTTNYTTWSNQSWTVTGDTAKLHFVSDGGGNYNGYYAIITGTGTIMNRIATSGEYTIPTGTNLHFYGWSTTQTTPGGGLPSQVEYTNESEIKSEIPGDNGETKTLYAVWQQDQTITFTKDSNVSNITILDANGTTVGTITNSGQSLALTQGDTYTIKTTHTTGYSTNAITKTSGAGAINGRRFTVGNGATTINVTSHAILPMQNYDCSNIVDIGDTDIVYDTRDNETYLIGKLADNRCWLLDNLRLDLVTHKNDLNSTNTNATNAQLAYLKGTSAGTSSDKWAMSGVSYWTSSYSYSAPLIAIKNASDNNWNPNTVASVTFGEGSGKIGVYYNYCAASAGTYCWGNGTSYSGSPSTDPKEGTLYDIDGDICPKGWHLPTTGESGDYRDLYLAYYYSSPADPVAAFLNGLSTPLTGDFANGSAYSQGTLGLFWASSHYDTNRMRSMGVKSNDVYSIDEDDRKYGYSIRCVLDS